MRLLYTKPELKDLSQESRIAFVRQFRLMTQDEVSDKLGLTGECKRRTMTRYEKGERNPKDDRTYELSKILKVNYNAIKKYDFKDQSDILYTLMWLEELLPRYQIDLSRIPSINDDNIIKFKEFINEWEENEDLVINENRQKDIFIYSSNADKTFDELKELFTDYEVHIFNMEEEARTQKSLYILIAIFLYGFITVIALIGTTNIFNTITTNMSLRQREFATLKSIGMTNDEFNRMIRLETLFYCGKSLLIGLPIGILFTYIIYRLFNQGELIVKYVFPWSAIIIVCLILFILIFTIMKYSLDKIKKQNTIETIRNENI